LEKEGDQRHYLEKKTEESKTALPPGKSQGVVKEMADTMPWDVNGKEASYDDQKGGSRTRNFEREKNSKEWKKKGGGSVVEKR